MQPVFSDAQRLALAGYRGLTREACTLELEARSRARREAATQGSVRPELAICLLSGNIVQGKVEKRQRQKEVDNGPV